MATNKKADQFTVWSLLFLKFSDGSPHGFCGPENYFTNEVSVETFMRSVLYEDLPNFLKIIMYHLVEGDSRQYTK